MEERSLGVTEEVVGIISGVAATETPGVAGLAGDLVGNLNEMLGRRGFGRGVRTELRDGEARIDLFLVVEYGEQIPVVARQAQDNVRLAVERLTGIRVAAVNIHVQGVRNGGKQG